MYEFEFWDEESRQYIYYFGHSIKDLKRRFPNVDFDKYELTLKLYVD